MPYVPAEVDVRHGLEPEPLENVVVHGARQNMEAFSRTPLCEAFW